MKNKYFGIVLKKELTDMFRDRKTLIVGLVLPLVLYPLMFFVMDKAMGGITGTPENTVVGLYADAETEAIFKNDIFTPDTGVVINSPEDYKSALDSGEIDVAVTAQKNAAGKMELVVIYDENRTPSVMGYSYVQSLVGTYSEAEVSKQLAELDIDLTSLSPIASQMYVNSGAINENGEIDGEAADGGASMILVMIVPMLITVFLAVGGMAVSADIFAGEKERKTFEPLLCTRAARFDILTGKLVAVTVMSFVTVAASFAGMVLGYLSAPAMFSMGTEGTASAGPFVINPGMLALTALLIIMMAITFSGIYACVSMYSRTIKEATTYSSFVMLASYMPTFATMYLQGGDIEIWMMAVPIVNIVGTLKMVLAGMVNYSFLVLALAASAIFLAAVMAFTMRMFKKEHILFRV